LPRARGVALWIDEFFILEVKVQVEKLVVGMTIVLEPGSVRVVEASEKCGQALASV